MSPTIHPHGWLGKPPDDVASRAAGESEAMTVLRGVRDAAETLRAGVTTVRNVGTRADLELDRVIHEGLVVGPRIVGAGRVICVTVTTATSWASRRTDRRGSAQPAIGAPSRPTGPLGSASWRSTHLDEGRTTRGARRRPTR